MRFFRVEWRGQIIDHRIEQGWTPLFLNAVPRHRNNFSPIVDLRSDAFSSSAEIASPSRNLCRISSSFSATVSTSWVWNASAFSADPRGCRQSYTLRRSTRLPDDGLHLDQIHYTSELVFLSDGNLNGNRLGVEALAEVSTACSKSAPSCHLVDETNSRTPYLSA